MQLLSQLKSINTSYYMGYYDLNPIATDKNILCLGWKGQNMGVVTLSEWNFETNLMTTITDAAAFSQQMGNRQTYIKSDEYMTFREYQSGKVIGKLKHRVSGEELEIEPYFAMSIGGHYVPWNWLPYSQLRTSYGFLKLCQENKFTSFNFNAQKVGLKEIGTHQETAVLTHSDVQALLETNENFLIDHVQISPSGRSMAFIAKPAVSNVGASSAFFIWRRRLGWKQIGDFTQVSHYNFDKDDNIIIFAERKKIVSRNSKSLRKIYRYIKPVFQTFNKGNRLTSKLFNQQYFLIGQDNCISAVRSLPVGQDGHPSLSKEIIITDTYPDSKGNISLIKSQQDRRASGLFERKNLNYDINFIDGADRVDLHPKFNANLNIVCVDRLVENTRFVEVYSIQ